ncbi:hypothetical protein IKR55_00535 [bacterium]|nr:hypothetical protein [bacterium]
MSDEKHETKKETKYTTEALANCRLWKADIANAFLEKDKTYTIADAKKIIEKKLKGE